MGQIAGRLHIERREVRGTPLAVRGWRMTPVKRAVQLTWPGGAWLWQRPVAVEVQEDGSTRRIPISNITRRALVGMALGMALIAVLTRRPQRARGQQQ